MPQMRSKHTLVKCYNRRESTAADGVEDDYVLFGLACNIKLIKEWSLARAGAHVIAQMSKFVTNEESRSAIRDVFDTLVGAERQSTLLKLGGE